MKPLVLEGLEDYARSCSTKPGEVYEALREETYASTELPQMQVGHLVGCFLTLMTRLSGARRAVEVGTFTGYSSLAIAEGLKADGELITCDINPDTTKLAQRYWAAAPWGSKINARLGPALQTLQSLKGPFDLAFIDADKGNYVQYWEALVPLMRPGGFILADNVLWSGAVLDPQDDDTKALVAFSRHVAQDTRVEQTLLTIRDGLTLAVVK